jgi:poly-gamma-glutamate synthesis protein (capsule biosynthesis protein)
MRLKKWVKITLILIGSLLILFLVLNTFLKSDKKKEKEEPVKETKVDYEKIVNYKLNDKGITKEFIKWVDENYNGSIEKLSKLLYEKEYDEKIWHEITGNSFLVLNDLYNKKYDQMDNVKIIETNGESTLSFVGDVSLADNWTIMPYYDSRGKKIYGILSEEVVKTMTSSTLMVVNNEFTISKRGTEMAGKQYTFRADPSRLSIYNEMGVDLVTLANNHVYDFGRDAFLDMMDALDDFKMPHIGAGRNSSEAMKPYYFIIGGYKFAFVNATRAEKYILTPEAKEDSPGVFRCYDPTNMQNLISEVRKESDYVIAIIHFGKEGYHELEDEQVRSAKLYVDAGADSVIGHHAHALQGIEIYNDKPIIYNLGDFIFNGLKEETAMFQIKLKEDGSMDYYIIPALQNNCYTDFLKDEEKQSLINKILSWSINTNIDSDGKITKK